MAYDIAGGLTADGVHTYDHDPFGQIRQIDGASGRFQSAYNADGERVGNYEEGHALSADMRN